MKLIIAPNPILKQPCVPCGPLDVRTIVQAFALLQQHKGLGLAAPQMGISERWFVTAWGELFVNPTIEATFKNQIDSQEGCLSIPGKQFVVKRWQYIMVQGRRYDHEKAIVIQHELDHLDGVLISDVGVPV